MQAAINGNNDRINTLVLNGAAVNEKAGHGWTALHWAIWQSDQNIETVHLLLKLGADPNIRGKELDWTPLQIATFFGDIESFKLLVEFGGDCRQIDNQGKSLLHSISNAELDHRGISIDENRLTEMSKIVLSNNVNIDQQSNHGDTALMIAAKMGHYELVKVFLSANANLSIVNSKGETAISLAKQREKNLNNHYEKIIKDDPRFYSDIELAKKTVHDRLLQQKELILTLQFNSSKQ